MPKKHGLGFMINLEQEPGKRAPDSLYRAGLSNTCFWFDPKGGITGPILMQILQLVDHKAIDLDGDFKNAVYASREQIEGLSGAAHAIERPLLLRVNGRTSRCPSLMSRKG